MGPSNPPHHVADSPAANRIEIGGRVESPGAFSAAASGSGYRARGNESAAVARKSQGKTIGHLGPHHGPDPAQAAWRCAGGPSRPACPLTDPCRFATLQIRWAAGPNDTRRARTMSSKSLGLEVPAMLLARLDE